MVAKHGRLLTCGAGTAFDDPMQTNKIETPRAFSSRLSAACGTLAAMLATLVAWPAPALAEHPCDLGEAVCGARAVVFRISSYDPAASAVRIGDKLLVTNRHVVADEVEVTVRLSDGGTVAGRVIATAYEGDLVLISADLPPGPVARRDDDADQGPYRVVGLDLERGEIAIAEQGERLAVPLAEAPFSRIHHRAETRAGNSGGALIDGEGELVGIATSGGSGRFEALPLAAIDAVKGQSGEQYAERSAEIGRAYRECEALLGEAIRADNPLPEQLGARMRERCLASSNRQLIDLAAQAAGGGGDLDMAIELFQAALKRDPLAINTRVGLVTALHFSARFAEAVPVIEGLLDAIPDDPQVQRFAVQAGKWGGKPELAARGLALVERRDPEEAKAAARFLQADIPPPDPARPMQH